MRSLETKETASPDLVSMVMFEPRYTERLLAIGEADIEACLDELRCFFEDDARALTAV
jgi:hypothetical protein